MHMGFPEHSNKENQEVRGLIFRGFGILMIATGLDPSAEP